MRCDSYVDLKTRLIQTAAGSFDLSFIRLPLHSAALTQDDELHSNSVRVFGGGREAKEV